MFHQNPQHTGLSPFLGPAVPFLTWKFQTSGRVDSPPAVGHGRIYLTSEDGNVYALNPQGVLNGSSGPVARLEQLQRSGLMGQSTLVVVARVDPLPVRLREFSTRLIRAGN